MKRKFSVCVLVLILSLFSVIGGGIAVISLFSEKGLNIAIERCNRILEDKYLSGVFLYKTTLSYKSLEKSFFSENGFVEINLEGSPRTYNIPVHLSYGFLTLDVDFDFARIVDRIFIQQDILGEQTRTRGRLHVRLIPFDMKFEVSVNGPYSSFVREQGVVKEFAGNYLELSVYALICKNSFGNTVLAFEASNVFLPGFSADRIYFMDTYTQGKRFLKPQRARLYADGLAIDDKLLGQLKAIDIKLNVPRVSSIGDFDIDVRSDIKTHSGDGYLEGRISRLNSYSMGRKSKTWTDLLFYPEMITAYTNGDFVSFAVKNAEFKADLATDDGKLKYTARTSGMITAPKSDKGIADNYKNVKGAFVVRFDGMNRKGRDYIKSLGGRFLEENKNSLTTDMTIDKGKLVFSGKVF
ncbi:MAG: hypothetical protein ACI4UM_07220 [Succinivibrio sp.]